MIKVKALSPEAQIPRRSHTTDAGFDLFSAENHILAPYERHTIGTGIAVAIPENFVGFVCSRSGLAAKHGVRVVNAPGIVDSGYRGEVKVILEYRPEHYEDAHPVSIDIGTRIAQLVVVPCLTTMVRAQGLNDSDRGDAGFGSTGA